MKSPEGNLALLDFIQRFGPLARSVSLHDSLSQLCLALVDAFGGEVATIWVPRNEVVRGPDGSFDTDNPLRMAFTLVPWEHVNPFYRSTRRDRVNQTIPAVLSRTRHCITMGKSAFYPELVPSRGDVIPCSQPGVLRSLGYDATWCCLISSRIDDCSGKQQGVPIQVVVTIDGKADRMVLPENYRFPLTQADVDAQELPEAWTNILGYAGQQIQRSLRMENDRVNQACVETLASINVSRRDALNQMAKSIADVLHFRACTLFISDEAAEILHPAGTTGLLGRRSLRTMGCSLHAVGPTAQAARDRSQVVAEAGVPSEPWAEEDRELDDDCEIEDGAQVVTSAIVQRRGKKDETLLGVLRLRDSLGCIGGTDMQRHRYPITVLDRFRIEQAAHALVPVLLIESELTSREFAIQRFRHDQRMPSTAVRNAAESLRHVELGKAINLARSMVAGRNAAGPVSARRAGFEILQLLNEARDELVIIQDLAEIMILISDISRLAADESTTQLDRGLTDIFQKVVQPLVGVAGRIARLQITRIPNPIVVDKASFGPMPQFSVDVKLVRIAFYNLLENALKYSFSDSPVQISAIDSEVPGFWSVAIENFGTEIADSETEAIFRPHFRAREALSVPAGSGLGLGYARQIMRLHKGDLRLMSRRPNRFSLLFPVSASG